MFFPFKSIVFFNRYFINAYVSLKTPISLANTNFLDKRMSLGEFLMDDSIGGGVSWAKDDFDISNLTQDDSDPFFSRGTPTGGNQLGSGPMVLVTNLPSDSDKQLIDDLFKSRFFKYSNCEVFNDPKSARSKLAVVTLKSSRDVETVVKWRMIPLDGHKIHFDYCDLRTLTDIKRWNEENKPKNTTVKKDLPKLAPPKKANVNPFGNAKPVKDSTLDIPIISENTAELKRLAVTPKILQRPKVIEQEPEEPLEKSNPFGSAKPVDTLSRQIEIERKLKMGVVNSTTVSTKKIHDLEKEKEKQKQKLEKVKLEKVRLEKERLEKQGLEQEMDRLKKEKLKKEGKVPNQNVKNDKKSKKKVKNNKNNDNLNKGLKSKENHNDIAKDAENVNEVDKEEVKDKFSKTPKGPKGFKPRNKSVSPKVEDVKVKPEAEKEHTPPVKEASEEVVIKKGKIVSKKPKQKAFKPPKKQVHEVVALVEKAQSEAKKSEKPQVATEIKQSSTGEEEPVDGVKVAQKKKYVSRRKFGYAGKNFDPTYRQKKREEATGGGGGDSL